MRRRTFGSLLKPSAVSRSPRWEVILRMKKSANEVYYYFIIRMAVQFARSFAGYFLYNKVLNRLYDLSKPGSLTPRGCSTNK